MKVCFTCTSFKPCCACSWGDCGKDGSFIEDCWELNCPYWSGPRELSPAQARQLERKKEARTGTLE